MCVCVCGGEKTWFELNNSLILSRASDIFLFSNGMMMIVEIRHESRKLNIDPLRYFG